MQMAGRVSLYAPNISKTQYTTMEDVASAYHWGFWMHAYQAVPIFMAFSVTVMPCNCADFYDDFPRDGRGIEQLRNFDSEAARF